MSRAKNKAQRLLLIEKILLAYPEGLRPAEIARMLGVHRSTVGRYLPDLPDTIYIDDDGRWKIDRSAYKVNLRLNLHEILAIHLAARMMATRTDKINPHAEGALTTIARAIESLTPSISHHIQRSARLMTRGKRMNRKYLRNLENLTQAWADGRIVIVYHRHLKTGEIHRYRFAPYFIEPYPIGFSIHVIGWRQPPDAIRIFKLERIERTQLTNEKYEIPKNFDPTRLLRRSWGIWLSDQEPVDVVLRFAPGVVRRLKENRWHPAEKLEDQPDGSVIWRATLSDTTEILPWIRSWGPSVEVLAPEELRQQFIRESQALHALYLPDS